MTEQEKHNVLQLCLKKYGQEGFAHPVRVQHYVVSDVRYVLLDREKQDLVWAAALCHDLLEDTDVTKQEIIDCFDSPYGGEQLYYVIDLLTNRSLPYPEYIRKIVSSGCDAAILVKQADVKDHFSQLKTLTPKLREKYKAVIPLLLRF